MSSIVILVTIVFSILIKQRTVNGGTDEEMRQLITAKLNNSDYSPRVRPIKDTGNVLDLYVDMYLVSINKVEEVTQKITTTAYMKIVWSDTFMTWEPTDYGNITQFSLPQDNLWKPDLALSNAYETVSGLGARFMYVVVTYDGNITWEPFQVFESTCRLDMTYFPFDTHICNLEMATWSSTRDMIQILPGADGFNIDDFEENANWYLESVSTFDSSTSLTSELSFSLTIKRKPVYYILNVMIPIFLLSILNNFVFILPCSSGEKLTYSIILFLSFAIFLLIVTETMPEGMHTTPIVTFYLVVECVFSTSIVMITIVQLRLHNKGDKIPVPITFQKITKSIQHITNKITFQNQKMSENDTKEIDSQTNDKSKTSMNFKLSLQHMCCGTTDMINASDDIELDAWDRRYGRTSEKTDFRLAHILGNSNRVEPAAFFNKPSVVYPIYDKDAGIEDIEDDDKELPGKPTKLEKVYYGSSIQKDNRQLDIKESKITESGTGSTKLEAKTSVDITWPEFVQALDTIFLVLSIVINTIATMVASLLAYAN